MNEAGIATAVTGSTAATSAGVLVDDATDSAGDGEVVAGDDGELLVFVLDDDEPLSPPWNE